MYFCNVRVNKYKYDLNEIHQYEFYINYATLMWTVNVKFVDVS